MYPKLNFFLIYLIPFNANIESLTKQKKGTKFSLVAQLATML